MVSKIGIDAGGTLVKVAYEEQKQLHLKTFPTHKIDQAIQWLQVQAPSTELILTGGQAGHIKRISRNTCHLIDEFQAATLGARYLLHVEKGLTNEDFVLVNIGTGTSFFHVTPDSYERVLGTGIGGGTLMGLGRVISGKQDFHELTLMAEKGDNRNSDLLVRDIYAPDEPPIFGDFTAANFGKAHLNEHATTDDYVASLMQLIAETIILLAGQLASEKQVSKIVFVGSTVTNNKALQAILRNSRKLMPFEPIFLEKGSHAGAIGALMV
ncbi:type II pantothenate kinase [Ornithinibacillus contaminans]|uniref:type II pantothenate kinase n=1 Tax=Ornithinibacillus contaminans TaxID=694055 RepID=UPI00064DFDE1|nr:type II pantothenate kinase [Ornithinibacillus contaminans]